MYTAMQSIFAVIYHNNKPLHDSKKSYLKQNTVSYFFSNGNFGYMYVHKVRLYFYNCKTLYNDLLKMHHIKEHNHNTTMLMQTEEGPPKLFVFQLNK